MSDYTTQNFQRLDKRLMKIQAELEIANRLKAIEIMATDTGFHNSLPFKFLKKIAGEDLE